MSSINLTWNADGNIDSYNIYRSTTTMDQSSLPAPLITGITSKSYSDTTVVAGMTYFYRVASLNDGVAKISSEISVNAINLAQLAFVPNSSRNAGVSGAMTSLDIKIAPYLAGDIVLIVGFSLSTPSTSGFSLIYESTNGFRVLAKIAATASAAETTKTVSMGYGGLASFVLRPSRTVTSISCNGSISTYTAPAVANDTVVRALSTPALTTDKYEFFEIDALKWESVYSSVTPVTTITTDQSIIASRTYPATAGYSFDFVVAGKSRSNITSLPGATFNITKIPPSNQTINAMTLGIYAS